MNDPLRDELFAGTAGGGASLNSASLLAPQATRLDEAVVALSFGAREESIAYMGRVLPALTQGARKVRSFGSTALDMVQVAASRIGAFVQMGTQVKTVRSFQDGDFVVHHSEYFLFGKAQIGFDVFRYEHGKIVEHWGVPDLFGIMAQIGPERH